MPIDSKQGYVECDQVNAQLGTRATFSLPSTLGMIRNPSLQFTITLEFPYLGVLPPAGGGGISNSGQIFLQDAYLTNTAILGQTQPTNAADVFAYPTTANRSHLVASVSPALGSIKAYQSYECCASGRNWWKSGDAAATSDPNAPVFTDSFFNYAGAKTPANPFFNASYPYECLLTAGGLMYGGRCFWPGTDTSPLTDVNLYPTIVTNVTWPVTQLYGAPPWKALTPYFIFCNMLVDQANYATDPFRGLGILGTIVDKLSLSRTNGQLIAEINSGENISNYITYPMLSMVGDEAKLLDMRNRTGIYHMAPFLDPEGTILRGTKATERATSYRITNRHPIYRTSQPDSRLIVTQQYDVPIPFSIGQNWPVHLLAQGSQASIIPNSLELGLNIANFRPTAWTTQQQLYSALIDSHADSILQKTTASNITDAPQADKALFYDEPCIVKINCIPMMPDMVNRWGAFDPKTPIPGFTQPLDHRSGAAGCIMQTWCNYIELETDSLEDVLGDPCLTLDDAYPVTSDVNKLGSYPDTAFRKGYPLSRLHSGFTVFSKVVYCSTATSSTDYHDILKSDTAAKDFLLAGSAIQACIGEPILRDVHSSTYVYGNQIASITLVSKHTLSNDALSLDASSFVKTVASDYDERNYNKVKVRVNFTNPICFEGLIFGADYSTFLEPEAFVVNNGLAMNAAYTSLPNAGKNLNAGYNAAKSACSWFEDNGLNLRHAKVNNAPAAKEDLRLGGLTFRPNFHLSLLIATSTPCFPNTPLQACTPTSLNIWHQSQYNTYQDAGVGGAMTSEFSHDVYGTDLSDTLNVIGQMRAQPSIILPLNATISNLRFAYDKVTLTASQEQMLQDAVNSQEGLNLVGVDFTETYVPIQANGNPTLNFTVAQQQVFGLRFGARTSNHEQYFGCPSPAQPFVGLNSLRILWDNIQVVQQTAYWCGQNFSSKIPVCMPNLTEPFNSRWTMNPCAIRKGRVQQINIDSWANLVGAIYGADPTNGDNANRPLNYQLFHMLNLNMASLWVPALGGPARFKPGASLQIQFTLQQKYESSVAFPVYINGQVALNNVTSNAAYNFSGGALTPITYNQLFTCNGTATAADQPSTWAMLTSGWANASIQKPQAETGTLFGFDQWDYSLAITSLPLNGGGNMNAYACGIRSMCPYVTSFAHTGYNPGVNNFANFSYSQFPHGVIDGRAVAGCQQIKWLDPTPLVPTAFPQTSLNFVLTTIFKRITKITSRQIDGTASRQTLVTILS
jgi:hypothetical protein